MGMIGREPARAPLTSADINNDIITADDLVTTLDLSSKTLTLPTLSSATITSADINGGTIDGADVTVGAGKTLDVSAGTLTLANDQISGDKIEGGTIGSVTITTADINGGTLDGVTIGGSSAGAGSFTTLTASGDVNFDSGTLFVDASADAVGIGTTSPEGLLSFLATASNTPKIRLQSASTDVDVAVSSYADANGTYAAFGANHYLDSGGNDAAFDATKRSAYVFVDGRNLGGVVFGTAASGTATERMRIDSSGNVGIGTSSPSRKLHVDASGVTALFGNTEANNSIELTRTTSSASYVGLAANSSAAGIIAGPTFTFSTSNSGGGAITERMRITSAGNVGIGTSSPNDLLSLQSSGAVDLSYNTTATGSGVSLGRSLYRWQGTDVAQIRVTTGTDTANHDDAYMSFFTSDGTFAERMRIDSSGNLLVGKTSSSFSNVRAEFATTDTSTNIASGAGAAISIQNLSTTNNTYSSIYFLNGAGVPDSSIYGLHEVANGTGTGRTGSLVFATANLGGGVSERMRIDSSGNLLVGTTSTGAAAGGSGTSGININASGAIEVARSANPVMFVNRTTSDGDIVQFRKDGSTVGSIGSVSGTSTYYGSNSNTGYLVSGGSFQFTWSIYDFSPYFDNARDLGQSGKRYDDVYATNGTIQTSDANEKQDIEELSEAERRVAVAAKGLLRKFRWISSVEEKGDDARIHFGIIAQDLQAAFEAEGLDAGRYAMFIHSTWTDEETGEERSRMGVRYSELLAFIIAAL